MSALSTTAFTHFFYTSSLTRVLIGFSFTPMLSGDRSSGDIQNGLRGLRGLQSSWLGLYRPYPMKKYSIGISIACGCSSVTSDPHAWTCNACQLPDLDLETSNSLNDREPCRLLLTTSTRAQYLLSSFDVMWTASVWNWEFSPTKIRVLHWSCFSCSVKSYLLKIN